MSSLFGTDSEKLQKSNIMKDDFGWEIPVELAPLPSEGRLYDPNSALYNKKTLKIKAMTAKEEDILMSPALIKEGTALDHVIKSCLIDKSFNIEELLVGDKNAILTAIRVTGYGSDYGVKVRCNSCSAFNDLKINLSDIKINRLKIEPHSKDSNLFLFKLPITGKNVLFKFNSIKTERAKQQHIENLQKANLGNTVGYVTTSLEYSIHSIDGVSDKNKIKHFIMNMPARDAKELRKYIAENEPGMDMKDNFICKNCNSHNEFDIPITSNFFWPS